LSVEENYRDRYFSHLNFTFWKLALQVGKLNDAKILAEKSLKYLIEYKRIPQLDLLLRSLEEVGLLKNKLSNYQRKRDVLKGIRRDTFEFFSDDFEQLTDHPEHWKIYPEFVSNYLILDEEWSLKEWKLCYEFILKYHYEKALFLLLAEKAGELGKLEAQNFFIEFLKEKKIHFKKRESKLEKNKVFKNDQLLIIDYDQVAMDLLSGLTGPTDEEQNRVLNSLKFIPTEELLSRGQDMVVAFELLGMERVVLSLCEQITKISKDEKIIIGTYYVWGQALINLENYFKVVELADQVLEERPVYGEERLAFLYLKAEAYFKLKKMILAKELYLEIKKENPHYRLLRERLKVIEAY
jgi:hypothetical protein